MTDKEARQQTQRIKKLVKKWVRPLGLDWWDWRINYIREKQEPGTRNEYEPRVVNEVWECAMETGCDPYYLTATINCYLPVCADLDERQLEETFVHELMHIFLSPMRTPKKSDEEERVATTLARAFIWTREK